MSQDFRLAPAAVSAWLAAAWITQGQSWIWVGLVMAIALLWWRFPEVLMCVVVAAIVAVSAGVRLDQRRDARFDGLTTATMRVHTEPRSTSREQWWFIASIDRLPVSVSASHDVEVNVGDHITAEVYFRDSEDTRYAAYVDLHNVVNVQQSPWWWQWSNPVRAAITAAAKRGPPAGATLVPALVHGDDSAQSQETQIAFRRSGLTHLLAVSGTNLTIVLALVLGIAIAMGVKGRWRIVLGIAAVAGFVILARPEPSVVRAAAMGSVAVLGLRRGSRGGVRALAWAIMVLLVFDPWLSSAAGFILSVSATAGILFFVPKWTPLIRLPEPLALAITVPLAAQLACAPMLVVISGEISLVAIVANAVAAPFVAPATIFGLLGGLVYLVIPPLGSSIGFLGASCAHVIVQIAMAAAGFAGATFSWAAPWWALALLCGALAIAMPFFFRHTWAGIALVVALGVIIWQPLHLGWPPQGWVMVACDVGQGDGLVVNAGDGDAIVIDAGGEPFSMSRCLDRLRIKKVRMFVITHQHLDHYGGASAIDVPPTEVKAGQRYKINDVELEVIAPQGPGNPDDPNNSSAVMIATVAGTRILLTGDIEAETQQELVTAIADGVDVLKVPHHGSGDFDPSFISASKARIAIISAGQNNDYGHPHADLLQALRGAHMLIARTDEMGDIAIVRDHTRVLVVAR